MSVSSGPGATRQRQSKGERERAAPTGPRRTTADGAVERLAVTIALQKQSAKSQDKKKWGWRRRSTLGVPFMGWHSSPRQHLQSYALHPRLRKKRKKKRIWTLHANGQLTEEEGKGAGGVVAPLFSSARLNQHPLAVPSNESLSWIKTHLTTHI